MNKFLLSLVLFFGLIFLFRGNDFTNDKKVDISPLKKFSEECCLKTSNSLPSEIPKDVRFVVKKRIIDDDYKAYVSLIFLKVFYYQLKEFKHGLEINEPFSFNENILMTAFKKFGSDVLSDFNTTDIAYSLVCSDESFIDNYKQVNVLCQSIENEYNSINNNLK